MSRRSLTLALPFLLAGLCASAAGAQTGALPRHADWRSGQVFRDCRACPEMVVIPSGTFMMGSPPAPEFGGEHPLHSVSLQRFAMGRYEVTRGEWAAFVAATHRRDPRVTGRLSRCTWREPGIPQDDRHPVACVNFVDAQAYARWLTRRTGHRYRLPSESEWEYAARAGTTTAFSFGDAVRPDQAQYNWAETDRESPIRAAPTGTAPVGSFSPNAFGLYDMHGNVWEWVSDCHEDTYAGAPTNGAPATSGDCDYRVNRSGSWADGPWSIRSARRIGLDNWVRDHGGGFRLVRKLPASPVE